MNPDDIPLTDEERQPCEVWTRVMGYHRPTTEYNPGKRSEHQERTHFRESRAAPATGQSAPTQRA